MRARMQVSAILISTAPVFGRKGSLMERKGFVLKGTSQSVEMIIGLLENKRACNCGLRRL